MPTKWIDRSDVFIAVIVILALIYFGIPLLDSITCDLRSAMLP